MRRWKSPDGQKDLEAEDVTVFFSVCLRGERVGALALALISPNDMLDISSSTGTTRNVNFITALKFPAQS